MGRTPVLLKELMPLLLDPSVTDLSSVCRSQMTCTPPRTKPKEEEDELGGNGVGIGHRCLSASITEKKPAAWRRKGRAPFQMWHMVELELGESAN